MSSIDTTGMSMQSLIDWLTHSNGPLNVELTSPLLEEQYQKSLPSTEEQQQLREMVPADCSYPQCGTNSKLSELKVCSGCKQARYCGKECQVLHWEAAHKPECRSRQSRSSIILKLAERALSVPQLVEWLIELAIATLGVVNDTYAGSRFAVNIQCTVLPVDILTILRGEVGPRTLRSINILGVSAVPLEKAPDCTRDIGLSMGTALNLCPVAVMYFSTPQDATGDGGAVSVAYPLHRHVIHFMANRPTVVVQSAIIGDVAVDINKKSLIKFFNEYVRMDKDNRMRLHTHRAA